MPSDFTEAEILAVRVENPRWGKRRIARALAPSVEDERVIQRLSSRVERVLRKHRPVRPKSDPETDPAVPPRVQEAAPSCPSLTKPGRRQESEQVRTLRQDIKDLREDLPLIRKDRSWQARASNTRLIRQMEAELAQMIAAESAINTDDIDESRYLKLMLQMPEELLQLALDRKRQGGW